HQAEKLMTNRTKSLIAAAIAGQLMFLPCLRAAEQSSKKSDSATVKSEHDTIGVGKEEAGSHTTHPDAQWFPDAGFGLFIHWGVASVKASNISWPMIPGRALAAKSIDDPAERERIIRE